jgi:cellulose synthase/poly-beta-1,6-N-acetylglucosamine synthase-like glycosyltransferase
LEANLADELDGHPEAGDERPELSAIVLCYRAGEDVLRVVGPLHDQLGDAGIAFQIVLVANFWPDRQDVTPSVVEDFGREHEHVTTVVRPKRGAMGWDMRSGFAVARGRYLVVIDGDAQNPVDDVLRMYRLMRQTGCEVMKGRRIARFDGAYRRLVSVAYNGLFRLVFGTGGLWDINGKPKGLTREAYQRMTLRSDDWFIDAEIVLSARRRGLTLAELPVVFNRNDERASFVRPSAILEFARNMARQRFRRRG